MKVKGEQLELTSFEYKVLEYLMLHAGEVLSKTQITEALYEEDFERDSNVIEVFIGRLRRSSTPSPIQADRNAARPRLSARHRARGSRSRLIRVSLLIHGPRPLPTRARRPMGQRRADRAVRLHDRRARPRVRQSIDQALLEVLEAHVDGLVAAAESGPGGELTMPVGNLDPEFQVANSGMFGAVLTRKAA